MSSTGIPDDHFCFEISDDGNLAVSKRGFSERAQTAIGRSRFVPATKDGQAVAVFANLKSQFNCDSETCEIRSVMNHGHHTESFGIGYFEP